MQISITVIVPSPVTLAPTDQDFRLLLELAGHFKVAARVPQTSP
jgi:hypothetical protein